MRVTSNSMHQMGSAQAHENGHRSKIGARFLRWLAALLVCSGLSVAHAVDTFSHNDVMQLARGGASQLALSLIDEAQPRPALEPVEWMRWERLRIRILEQGEDWRMLEQRLRYLPGGLPQDFLDWASERRALALMHAGDYSGSRQLLRGLIWRAATPPAGERLAEYRQWLIQGYMQEGRYDDALAAMQRYQLDYGNAGVDTQLLRARVLLASGRADQAREVLGRLPAEGEALWLGYLAALRAGSTAAETSLQQLRQAGVVEAHAALIHGARAEAAQRAGQLPNHILALQQYLSLPEAQRERETLFSWQGDDLWRAWLAFADESGNREQLLIGDDAAWWRAAEETTPRYPVRKRALHAFLALRSGDEAMRLRAHEALAEILQEDDQVGGQRLLRELYLHSPAHLPVDALPEPVAHRLVDEAIRMGDLRLASRLMQQLDEPPGELARFSWQMRRAKVFLLAAEFDAVEQLLTEWIEQAPRLAESQRDQMMQLLFDLQNVGRHEQAHAMLESLYQRLPIQSLRRELLFWMADSRIAQGHYVAAARLYLQSATLGDVNSMDPWAQTARYQAATALAKAGLLQDAAFIYRQLLRITESPDRRAVLLQELEQVQMRQAAVAE